MNGPVGEIPMALRTAQEEPPIIQQDAERARVLLVDDDERNLLAIATVLEDLGEVVSAKSGEEALRHLLKGEFAVILLDVYMPGMDGYETMQQIRQRPALAELPLIAVTAKAMKGDRQKCLDAGASDYIAKPVDIDLLLALLRVWIARAREGAVAAVPEHEAAAAE